MTNRYATIDVGTNSIRCLQAELSEDSLISSSKALEMTRIGEGVNATKMIKKERMMDSALAIKHFIKSASEFGAEKIFIMATSAVRDAINKSEFLDLVQQETGHEIEVISGLVEAEVGFLGVLLGAEPPEGLKLIIDIGGGSTELIIGDQEGIRFSTSLDIGAVRLTNMFVKDEVITALETEALKQYVLKQSKEAIKQIQNYKFDQVIGIGGTATTFTTMVHKIDKYDRNLVHNQKITIHEIQKMNLRMMSMTLLERKSIVGLDPKRADIIYAGGIILSTILDSLGVTTIISSDYDNLEGYLFYCLKQQNE